jgi:F-type H+-transporting ATPase subunit c
MKKLTAFIITFFSAALLLAEETASSGIMSEKGLIALGTGMAIGLAALGCGIGMGSAVSSAIEGTARNPETGKRLFVLLILGLAIIESLAIYALVVSFMLYFKL